MSVILISYIIGAQFTFSTHGFIFENPSNYLVVNSYSTLSMIVVLALGLSYILTKALLFHDTHINPKLTARLFHHKMVTLIQSSFELYSQAAIWLIYLYLITIVSIILGIFDVIYSWVAVASVILCGITTLLLIIDIEDELNSMESDFKEEVPPMSNNLGTQKQNG